MGVIDYSLYLTIDKFNVESDDKQEWVEDLKDQVKSRNIILSSDGKYIYQFGIIDYL